MTYEEFLGILMPYKKLNDEFSELYQMGFDFLEGKYLLEESISKIVDTAISSHYTVEGVDWINWFMFENEYGQRDWSKLPVYDTKTGKIVEDADPLKAYGAKDENGNPICYSFETTYEFVKQYLKNKPNE
jgi:hypothetical protein